MIRIERIEEFLIAPPLREQIQRLLQKSFPEYPGNRTYYKQLPDFRLLAFADQQLIGQLAVEYRMINNGGTVSSIFGIADICVEEAFQSQKTGSTLIEELSQLGKQHQIDFLVLFSDQNDFYLSNGFKLVKNTCRWLMINEHQTLGVGHRTMEGVLLVKPLGDKVWSKGLIDFLGHVF